jgi:hypothetical protein
MYAAAWSSVRQVRSSVRKLQLLSAMQDDGWYGGRSRGRGRSRGGTGRPRDRQSHADTHSVRQYGGTAAAEPGAHSGGGGGGRGAARGRKRMSGKDTWGNPEWRRAKLASMREDREDAEDEQNGDPTAQRQQVQAEIDSFVASNALEWRVSFNVGPGALRALVQKAKAQGLHWCAAHHISTVLWHALHMMHCAALHGGNAWTYGQWLTEAQQRTGVR